MKKLLISSGYSKFVALGEIDDNKVSQIEDHINNNLELLQNLSCCYSDEYKKMTKFAFLPGHKATILGIKTQVSAMRAAGLLVKKPRMIAKRIMERSGNDIQHALIKALDKYVTGLRLPAGIITERNIHDFKSETKGEKTEHSCVFSCVFCKKKFSIKYKGCWMKSNVTKHIKAHVKKADFKIEEVVVRVD